ncbi:MAG: hypothetical protein OEX83_09580 [Gammaproteobacteria bacterium]|nr:hypothetical protein [Gammaproteobacteria bacterium]
MFRLLGILTLIAAVSSQIGLNGFAVVFGQYTDMVAASVIAWLIGTQIRPWFE